MCFIMQIVFKPNQDCLLTMNDKFGQHVFCSSAAVTYPSETYQSQGLATPTLPLEGDELQFRRYLVAISGTPARSSCPVMMGPAGLMKTLSPALLTRSCLMGSAPFAKKSGYIRRPHHLTFFIAKVDLHASPHMLLPFGHREPSSTPPPILLQRS